MIPTALSGVLGHDSRRIKCSPPSGIYRNQGAVKAATSADTADLVSNQSSLGTLEQLLYCATHFSGYCSYTVVFGVHNFHFNEYMSLLRLYSLDL